MNDETKSLLASKAVWGGIVSILCGIAALVGYDLDADTQAAIVSLCVGAGSVVGGAVAVVGRVKATKRVAAPDTTAAMGKVMAGAGQLMGALKSKSGDGE